MKKKYLISIVILLIAMAFAYFLGLHSAKQAASATPYVYGTDPAKDSAPATPSTLEEKQQCATDGAAWYQKNVTDNNTPEAIAASNAQMGNIPSEEVISEYPGSVEYVYSTKLNTCLVEWSETASFEDGSTATTHAITDVYTNKEIADWFWNSKPGQSIQDAMKGGLGEDDYNSADFNLIQQQT